MSVSGQRGPTRLHESVYKNNLNLLQTLVNNKKEISHLTSGDQSVLKTKSVIERLNPFATKEVPETAIQQTFEKGILRIEKGEVVDSKELKKLKETARYVYRFKFDGKITKKTAELAFELFGKSDEVLKSHELLQQNSMRESLTRSQLGLSSTKSDEGSSSEMFRLLSKSQSTHSIPDLLKDAASSVRADVRRVRSERFEAIQREERYREMREEIKARSPNAPLRPSPDEIPPAIGRTQEAKPASTNDVSLIPEKKWVKVWARIQWLRNGGNYLVEINTKKGPKTVQVKETAYYEAETDRRILKLMTQLARSGDPKAEYELGIYYLSVGDQKNEGSESYTNTGMILLKRAARKKHAAAVTVLNNLKEREIPQS